MEQVETTIASTYCSSYSRVTCRGKIEVSFEAKGECGMDGPTQGTLSIVGFCTVNQAFGPVIYNAGTNELGFVTWYPVDGGARNRIHIMNINSQKKDTFDVDFGAYLITFLSEDLIVLTDSYDNKTRSVKRIQHSQHPL